MRLVLQLKDYEFYSQKALKIYWKLLIEIYLFVKKKNINYQIKFTLNLLIFYQSLFYSWNEIRDSEMKHLLPTV